MNEKKTKKRIKEGEGNEGETKRGRKTGVRVRALGDRKCGRKKKGEEVEADEKECELRERRRLSASYNEKQLPRYDVSTKPSACFLAKIQSD